jgi:hypothetical protein
VRGALPGGLVGRIESRLGGGRSAPVWLDADRPGGALLRPGRAAARTRIELARPGRIEPRLAWTQVATQMGRSGEVRLAVSWSAGSMPSSSRDDAAME